MSHSLFKYVHLVLLSCRCSQQHSDCLDNQCVCVFPRPWPETILLHVRCQETAGDNAKQHGLAETSVNGLCDGGISVTADITLRNKIYKTTASVFNCYISLLKSLP